MAENAARPEAVVIVETQSLPQPFCGQPPAGFGARDEMIEPLGRGHPKLTTQDTGLGSFPLQNLASPLSGKLDEVHRTGFALRPHNEVTHGRLLDLEEDGRARLREQAVV
jgi:hypothetical protein